MTWPTPRFAVGSLVRYDSRTFRIVGIASYRRMNEVQKGSCIEIAGPDYDQPFYLLRDLDAEAPRDQSAFNQVCERIAGGRVDLSYFTDFADTIAMTLVAGPTPNDNEVDD